MSRQVMGAQAEGVNLRRRKKTLANNSHEQSAKTAEIARGFPNEIISDGLVAAARTEGRQPYWNAKTRNA